MGNKEYPAEQILVGILTFNRWKYTEKTLENLLLYTDPKIHIIISDNGSIDDTLKNLDLFRESAYKRGFKNIEIIKNGKNLGIGRAINQVFSKGSEPFLVKLDNDILVQKDWLYYLWSIYKFFKDRFGACCLEVRDLDGKPEVPKSYTQGKIDAIYSDVFFEYTTIVNGTPLATTRNFWKTHKFAEDRCYAHEDARFVSKAHAIGLVSGQVRSPNSFVTHLQGDNAYRKYDLWKLHTSSRGDFNYRKDFSCLPLDGNEIKVEKI